MQKILALVLMLCMVLPQMASAVTTQYLEMSFSEVNPPYKKVEATSGALADSYSLADAVVEMINTVYDAQGADLQGDDLWIFDSPAMKKILDAGLEAYKDKTAWGNWVQEYVNETHVQDGDGTSIAFDFKEKLADQDTTIGTLEKNVQYTVSFTPANEHVADADDPAFGNTYVLSLKLVSTTTGGSGGGTSGATYPVNLEAAPGKSSVEIANGSIGVSAVASTASKTITITMTPDEGYRTNQVKVVDSKGNAVKVTAVSDNVYTFAMPASAVTVSGNFIIDIAMPEETGIAGTLNTDGKLVYMQGKDDGLFYPGANITRGQIAAVFYRLLTDEKVASVTSYTKKFSDVPDDFWCADAINTLAALGIVNGMTEDTFAPNAPITRAQFVAICARLSGEIREGEDFADVPESYWAHDYIETAAAFGWVNGVGGGLFEPYANITRAQAATIINRMLGRLPDRVAIDAKGEVRYADVPVTYWAYYDIWEASDGVISRPDTN